MSDENVQQGWRVLTAFNERGLAGLGEFLSDAVVWHTDPLVPEPGTYTGKEVVLAYLQGYIRAFEELKFETREVIDVGDNRVLAVATFGGPPRGSRGGQTNLVDWCLIATLSAGLITEIRSFFDRDRAMAAAGLSE